ncbi:MAG: Mov34/MPN/PAD-1 family protein, partial [Polyangiaceae bacterium]|nr:Mov34/MPN/PAD-1 family protein [Polyangiaceae bacterium]
MAPWIRGDLRIPAAILADIEAHSVECYPSEACGFVVGPASNPSLLDESIREVNEADKYHAMDPETFPRTSQMYFKLNELRAARSFDSGEKAGRPIKVIYHSHCDAGAYFSAEDAYTFASEGMLMWP